MILAFFDILRPSILEKLSLETLRISSPSITGMLATRIDTKIKQNSSADLTDSVHMHLDGCSDTIKLFVSFTECTSGVRLYVTVE